MEFNIYDIPEDVFWVWNIQLSRFLVGIDTWDKANEIIKANPKYFPWETKYHSLPKEVHDAYWNEKNTEADKKWSEYLKDQEQNGDFIGLLPTIMSMDKVKEYPPEPPKSLSEIFRDLFKQQDDERKRREQEDARNKALWDKYYISYGLEYRTH